MENESKFFKSFVESHKKSEEMSNSIISEKNSKKSISTNKNKPHLDFFSKKFNQTSSLKKTLEEPNKTVEKFIAKLKDFTFLKKIPGNFAKTIYEIMDDKSNFQKSQMRNREGIITNFLKIFSFCIIFWQKFQDLFKDYKFIIHPYKNYKIFWDLIHFLLMISLFFYLPLDIVFQFENSKNLRIFLSCFLMLDNLLGFSTAYFQHGKLITDRKKIFKAYIKNFIFDLFIQFSLIYDVFLVNEIQAGERDVIGKFMRLICLFQYRNFKQIYVTLVDRFKIEMKFGFLLDFINLIFTSICLMHWAACGWYFIGINGGEGKNWIQTLHSSENTEIFKYIHAFYWSAVTMMTVGYGDIIPQNIYETIFASIIVVMGCGLFAYYIKYENLPNKFHLFFSLVL